MTMTFKLIVILFILCGCICNSITAQNGINTIHKIGNNYSIFTESVWQKDTLFIVGTSIKDEGTTGLIAKYLYDGSFVNYNYLQDTFIDFGTGFWDKGLIIRDDTMYHIVSKGYEGTLHNGSLLKLDLNGNILKEKEFTSFYYPLDDFCRFKDFEQTESGFIILDYARKSDTDFQSCLIKTDTEFNQKWRKCYGNNSLEIPKDLLITSQNKYLTIANSTNLDISESWTGSGLGYYRGYIFETDSMGILKWEWRSSSKMEAFYAGILENDSTLVVAAGRGKEVCSDSQPNALCYFRWTGGVFKLNLNSREKVWDISLSGGPHTYMFDNRYLDIIQSIEKDGFILCGAGYDVIPDCSIDTVDKCWSKPGVIAKISSAGDSLWLRKYFGVADIYESNILYDAEITPDSGYSFVGEAFNPWPGETQGQHGWILMTDKYGCLVSGCQLISSSENSPERDVLISSPMKIYPNPTTNFINVLITRDLTNTASLYLFNSAGKLVDKWHSFEEGATCRFRSILTPLFRSKLTPLFRAC
jgi:hypothetical protein